MNGKVKNKTSLFLKISLVVLALSLIVLSYYFYQSEMKPLSGYGDDFTSMDMLKGKESEALSGGDLTHFMFGDVSFEAEALNLSWQLSALFDAGDGDFERPFSEAKKSGFRFDADGLGPLFNQRSCEGCHVADGRAAPPNSTGDALQGLLFRVSVPGKDKNGGPNSHPIYGGQLADKAIEGHKPEISYALDYEYITGQYGNGSTYTLQKPIYSFPQQNYGPLGENAMISPRIAPFMIGMGLLDAITEESDVYPIYFAIFTLNSIL